MMIGLRKQENYMEVYRENFKVQSTGMRPTFHTVTDSVKKIVEKSGIKKILIG